MTQCRKCGGRADAFLCWSCGERLDTELGRIPWLADRLAEAHTRQADLQDVAPPPRKLANEDDEESPVPFNGHARDLYDELRTVCMRWVRDLCDTNGVRFWPIDAVPHNFIGPLPKRGQWRMFDGYQPRTADLARWLRANRLSIMNHEDAAVCANEIHSTIERCLDGLNRRIPPAYRGPCPAIVTTGIKGKQVECETPLYAHRSDENGTVKTADVTVCPRCRTEHDTRQLEQRLLSDVEKYLMPADQIIQVMKELGEPVAKSTWHNWRAKGKIQPHAWRRNGRIVNYRITEDDEKLYRLDAVRKLRRDGLSATTKRPLTV